MYFKWKRIFPWNSVQDWSPAHPHKPHLQYGISSNRRRRLQSGWPNLPPWRAQLWLGQGRVGVWSRHMTANPNVTPVGGPCPADRMGVVTLL